jgi:hypothetical protein
MQYFGIISFTRWISDICGATRDTGDNPCNSSVLLRYLRTLSGPICWSAPKRSESSVCELNFTPVPRLRLWQESYVSSINNCIYYIVLLILHEDFGIKRSESNHRKLEGLGEETAWWPQYTDPSFTVELVIDGRPFDHRICLNLTPSEWIDNQRPPIHFIFLIYPGPSDVLSTC